MVLSYGLGWSTDHSLNYDLSKPKLLAPILGDDGLGKTRKDWKNFSPTLGMVWTPSQSGDTVLRSGAGLYYDFEAFQSNMDSERVALGRPGLGRYAFSGSAIRNPVPGVPNLPLDASLDFPRATTFTGAELLAILPAIRANLTRNITSGDSSRQQIEITKTGGVINGSRTPRTSALHANAGIQRRIAREFVITADLVYRRFNHVGFSVDANHFSSINDPAIRECEPFERSDPQALCSNGPINLIARAGRASYKGLLVRAEKRLSNEFQFLGSWAFSRNTGTSAANASGFNLLDWQENRGPLTTDSTHILNITGMARFRWGTALGFNFSYVSAPPFTASVAGIDFNGDGTTGDLLPGSTFNAFNRGMDSADLERLVDSFNQTHAGKTDALRSTIPRLALPSNYRFGDSFHSLDLRLNRTFPVGESASLTLVGDVFNAFNVANLSGHSGDLTNRSTFGQPDNRFSQVFGSGGPRSFQFGAKLSF
jgi:hypothetical protein